MLVSWCILVKIIKKINYIYIYIYIYIYKDNNYNIATSIISLKKPINADLLLTLAFFSNFAPLLSCALCASHRSPSFQSFVFELFGEEQWESPSTNGQRTRLNVAFIQCVMGSGTEKIKLTEKQI
jgi:hypothetical protein